MNPTSNHGASCPVLSESPWPWLLAGYRHRSPMHSDGSPKPWLSSSKAFNHMGTAQAKPLPSDLQDRDSRKE
jgi:hypothetical protein